MNFSVFVMSPVPSGGQLMTRSIYCRRGWVGGGVYLGGFGRLPGVGAGQAEIPGSTFQPHLHLMRKPGIRKMEIPILPKEPAAL